MIGDHVPAARRPEPGGLERVLDRERHPVQRAPHLVACERAIGVGGACPGTLDVERDDGVELAVQALDAREIVIEQLDAADLALAEAACECGGRREGRVHDAS